MNTSVYLTTESSPENTLALMAAHKANTTQNLAEIEKQLQNNFQWKKDVCQYIMYGSIFCAAISLLFSPPPVAMSIASITLLTWNMKKNYEDTEKQLQQSKSQELTKIQEIYDKVKRYLVDKQSIENNKKILQEINNNYTPLPEFEKEIKRYNDDSPDKPAEQRSLKDILGGLKL